MLLFVSLGRGEGEGGKSDSKRALNHEHEVGRKKCNC